LAVVLGQIRFEGEQRAGERGRPHRIQPAEGVVTEREGGVEAREQSVLGPSRLDRVRQRVLGRSRMLGRGEALAERVVGVLEVLGDVADGLRRSAVPRCPQSRAEMPGPARWCVPTNSASKVGPRRACGDGAEEGNSP
jgi:hypothetical protein